MTGFSLTRKAFLYAFITFLPVLVIFLFTYNKARTYIREDIFEDMSIVANGYESLVVQFMEMEKRRAVDFSSDGFIKDRLSEFELGMEGASARLRDHLVKNKISLDKAVKEILVISPDGRVAASTNPALTGRDLSGEEFFLKGAQETYLAESAAFGETALVVSSPIRRSDNGGPPGVIANVIPLTGVTALLSVNVKKNSGFKGWIREKRRGIDVLLVDKHKRLVGGASGGTMDIAPVKSCLELGTKMAGFYTNQRGDDVVGASACFPPLGWTLVVEMRKDTAMAPLNVIFSGALTIGGVVVIIAAGLLLAFISGIVRPLSVMAEAAGKIAGGDYDVSMPPRGGDEMGVLIKAFNTMSRDIRRRTRDLRESEKGLRTAQHTAKMGSWEWDALSGELWCSEEAYRILGVTPAPGMDYKALLATVHPGDRESLENGIKGALTDGTPLALDHMVSLPGGGTVAVHTHCEAEPGPDGRPVKLSVIVQDITERKATEERLLKKTEELDALNRELHELTMRMSLLETRERKRFAEILHESIGQNLAAVKLAVERQARKAEKDGQAGEFDRILGLLDETIGVSRTMTSDLYPAPFRDKGLVRSINWHVDSIFGATGMDVSLDVDEAVETLSEDRQHIIYSIIRECLQNTAKYASAKKVKVRCALADGYVRIAIADDGGGFNLEGVKRSRRRGFGLMLMRSWAKSVNGRFSVTTAPGKGTRVDVEFPSGL